MDAAWVEMLRTNIYFREISKKKKKSRVGKVNLVKSTI